MLVRCQCVKEFLKSRHLFRVIFHFLKLVLLGKLLTHLYQRNYSMIIGQSIIYEEENNKTEEFENHSSNILNLQNQKKVIGIQVSLAQVQN